MSMTEKLRLVIDGDSSGAKRSLKEFSDDVKKTDTGLRTWGKRLNMAADAAIVGGLAIASAVSLSAAKTIEYGQAIDDIADLSGLSAEATSKLAGQLYYFDIGLENAGNGIKYFEKNLDEARQGQAEYLEDFERLGFSLEELRSMGDEDILFRLRDSMADLGDKTARTAITLRLFGRSGADLADWLDAAPEDMEKLNKQLADMGLVWDDKKIENWQDLIDAQRQMRISMLALQMAISDPQFVGSMSSMLTQFTKFVNLIRPLAPALPYVAVGLIAIGSAVKVFNAYKMVRELGEGGKRLGALLKRMAGSGGTIRTFGLHLKGLATGGLAAARRGLGGLSTLLRGLPGLLSKSALAFGPYALAIGAVAIAVWEVVKAFKEWRRAEDFLKEATEERKQNEAAALDYIAQKYGENSDEYRKFAEQMKEMDRQIVANRKAELTGLAGWLQSWGAGSQGQWWLSGPAELVSNVIGTGGAQIASWMGLSEGGTIKARPGGTPVIAAEAGEDEDFVPASKRQAYARRVLGSGGVTNVFDFSGAQFGPGLTSRDVERVLNDTVVPRLLDSLAVA